MEKINEVIGQRIRSYRERKRITQARLSEIAGLHPTYIGQIERGEKNPTVDTVWKITKALGITMSELFTNIDITEKGTRSIPSKCYDLLLEKNTTEQEKLYRLFEEICEYGK